MVAEPSPRPRQQTPRATNSRTVTSGPLPGFTDVNTLVKAGGVHVGKDDLDVGAEDQAARLR